MSVMGVGFGIGMLVALILPQLFTRQREQDGQGRATIRYWGGGIFCGVCTLFWVGVLAVNVHDPMHWRYPERFFVEGGALLGSLGASLWFFYFKVTLLSNAILVRWFPGLTRIYLISEISEIQRGSSYAVSMEFRNDKKIRVFGGSGVPYFLESLQQRHSLVVSELSSTG